MTKIKMLVICVAALIVVSGCGTHFAPPVAATELPSSELAYVYGRFTRIEDPNKKDDETEFRQVVLVLNAREKKQKYLMRFEMENDVYAIAVQPGRYYIGEWAGTSKWGDIFIRQSLAEQINDNDFELKGGCAYYLGDFVSYFYWVTWGLDEVYYLCIPVNRFAETTRGLVETYPGLADVQKSEVFPGPFFKDEYNRPHRMEQNVKFIYIPIVVG